MRIISPTRAFCLSLLFVLVLGLTVGTTWLIFRHVPPGDFRGVILVTAGIIFFCVYSIAEYRLIVWLWPLPEGDIGEGSREEFIYHAHLIFYLMLFYSIIHSQILPVPFRRLFCQALGAHLGRNVFPAGILFDLPFVFIGDDAVIGYQVVLCPHLIIGKRLSHARIQIGKNVTIGIGAVVYGGAVVGDGAIISAGAIIGPHVIVGENAIVKPCSYVKAHTHVPPGEIWSGVPATAEPVKTPLENRT